ncbi:MAG TPA: ArgE/DapE family deacylase [Gemmatimonadaceae bacterium]|nr:ArgE/DapE family deacylase [Gemmatimonadaceae bacterium]
MTDAKIPRGDAVALTRALVAVDSRNPVIAPGGPGEGAAASLLAGVLAGWGFDVELQEVAPGRPNVIARTGRRGGPALMLNGHLDVVGTEGMVHPPFDPAIRDGRIYGRGSADMKGGIAAMCAAAARAATATNAELVIAAVIDEENESLGTRALVERGIRADAAIVTEPTQLAIMPAHRGFVWLEIELRGRAAHGSRYDIGIDAIRHAGLLLAELDAFEEQVLVSRTHPLLGRASLHASLVHGGIGLSTYPDRCMLSIERRTLPGETTESVIEEVREAFARISARRPAFDPSLRLITAQGPSDVSPGAPVVQSLARAIEGEGMTMAIEGMSAWTDAAILNAAGIPAICFGPGDIKLAHAAEESVPVGEIERATAVLTRLALDFGRS